jgi:hypothetical protein
VEVQCFYESEVLNPSSVLLMKFSAKNPHLRVAAKRYGSLKKRYQHKLTKNNDKFAENNLIEYVNTKYK